MSGEMSEYEYILERHTICVAIKDKWNMNKWNGWIFTINNPGEWVAGRPEALTAPVRTEYVLKR